MKKLSPWHPYSCSTSTWQIFPEHPPHLLFLHFFCTRVTLSRTSPSRGWSQSAQGGPDGVNRSSWPQRCQGGGSVHREGHSWNTCFREPWKSPLGMLMSRHCYFCFSLPFSNLSSSFRFSAILAITVLVILLQKHVFSGEQLGVQSIGKNTDQKSFSTVRASFPGDV